MGFPARVTYATIATVVDVVVAIIYFRIGEGHLFPMVSSGGPFSPIIGQMEAVFPLVLMIGLLFPWAYVIYGAVQDEKSVTRRRRQV